jgi:hypothetical protein
MLPEAFVCIQLAHLQRQQRMLRPMADTVMEWHRIELLGTAAILSGYKGTCPVPKSPLACVLVTRVCEVAAPQLVADGGQQLAECKSERIARACATTS